MMMSLTGIGSSSGARDRQRLGSMSGLDSGEPVRLLHRQESCIRCWCGADSFRGYDLADPAAHGRTRDRVARPRGSRIRRDSAYRVRPRDLARIGCETRYEVRPESDRRRPCNRGRHPRRRGAGTHRTCSRGAFPPGAAVPNVVTDAQQRQAARNCSGYSRADRPRRGGCAWVAAGAVGGSDAGARSWVGYSSVRMWPMRSAEARSSAIPLGSR
jgi:hypothetical protein